MKKILTFFLLLFGLTSFGQLATINVGTAPNAGNGDQLRTAFIKANAAINVINTTRLYQFSSSLPTALNLKAPKLNASFTGTFSMPSPYFLNGTAVTVNGLELNILDGALVTYTELNKLVGIGTDTIATRAYARTFGGGAITDTTNLSARIDLKADAADATLTGSATAEDISASGAVSGATGTFTVLSSPDTVRADIRSDRIILGDEVETTWIQADSNLVGNPVTRTFFDVQLAAYSGGTQVDSLLTVVTDQQAEIDALWAAVESIGAGDYTPPRFESAEIGTYNDSILAITMDNTDIQQDSVPNIASFTVKEDGVTFGLTAVSISNDTVYLALDSLGATGATYLVSYNAAADFPQLQDSSANKTISFTNKPVTNNISIFIAEYQAVWDELDIKPNADTTLLQNALATAWVNAGYWARTDLFYLNVQRSEAGAKLNWINPGGDDDITDPGSTAPAFTPYGSWTFDGTTDYLSTNYTASTEAVHVSQNSMTVIVWILNNASRTASFAIGAWDTDGTDSRLSINARNVGLTSGYVNTSSKAEATINPATSIGLTSYVRRGASETEMYKNGESLGTDTDASTKLITEALHINSENKDGVATAYGPWVTAIIIIMDATSDEEQLDIFNILNTYATGAGFGIAP